MQRDRAFEVRQGGFRPAEIGAGLRQPSVSQGEIGPPLRRPRERFQRRVEPAQPAFQLAQVAERLRIVGPELQRAAIPVLGRGRFATFRPHAGRGVVRLRVGRVDVQRALEARQRLVVAAETALHQAEEPMCGGIAGGERDAALARLERLVEATGIAQRAGEVELQERESGLQLRGMPELLRRLGGPAQRAQRVAERVERRQVPRLDLQRAPRLGLGLGIAARVLQCHRQVRVAVRGRGMPFQRALEPRNGLAVAARLQRDPGQCVQCLGVGRVARDDAEECGLGVRHVAAAQELARGLEQGVDGAGARSGLGDRDLQVARSMPSAPGRTNRDADAVRPEDRVQPDSSRLNSARAWSSRGDSMTSRRHHVRASSRRPSA